MTRQHRDLKRLWSTPDASMSLGCLGCPELAQCGGQTIYGNGFSCLDHCCNRPGDCHIVCPNADSFADRVREVKGLELRTPSADLLPNPAIDGYAPLVFHNSARAGNLAASTVAMPLYRFFDHSGDSRYQSREDVTAGFKVEFGAALLLTGVAQDHEVERWWKLELHGRLKAISNLRRIGVSMVTTPNFSLMVDRPRWDDLHSMKRIAQVYHELVSEGQVAALHVNGRTDRDFERWANYIAAHPEVTHLAYEFTTGAKNLDRMLQHTRWLITLAEASGRRLGLVLRGGIQVVAELSAPFDVTFIDSSPFEKAHHRSVAFIDSDGRRRWTPRHTPPGEPIDDLLNENVRVSGHWFQGILPKVALAA